MNRISCIICRQLILDFILNLKKYFKSARYNFFSYFFVTDLVSAALQGVYPIDNFTQRCNPSFLDLTNLDSNSLLAGKR